jgi:cytochrome c
MRTLALLHISAFICGFILGAACVQAQATPGQEAFEKRCGGCHGIDSAKEGPALRGVVGRRAGKQPSFPYSDALKAASFDWDKQTLDRWLTDPEAVVPGNDMAFRLTDSAERDRIIEYLAGLK